MTETAAKISGKDRLQSRLLPLKRMGKKIFKPEKPSFTLTLSAVFILLIAAIIYLVLQIGTYTINDALYYYDTGIKTEQEGRTKVFRSDDHGIVSFSMKNDGITTELTDPRSQASTPLYWEGEERMFLPAMMSVMKPSEGVQPLRTGFYTELRAAKKDEGKGFIAKVDKRDTPLEGGFLFDGQSVYVFLDDVTVNFLGQKVEMPAMSYAVVEAGLRTELYPYGGEPIVEQTGRVSISAVCDGYMIDLTNDMLQVDGEQVLLFTTPSILEVIK